MILVWFLALFVSLFILLKSADYFIDHSVEIGNKLNIPHFVLGATVIAFGTSLPELAVGISAIFKNDASIISGTVIGSNISNIFLITGLAVAVSSGFHVSFKKNAGALIILLVVTFLTSYFLWDNQVSITEGFISVIILIAYITYIVLYPPFEEDDEEEEGSFSLKTVLMLILSGFGIWLGAEYVVVAIKEIAQLIGIAEDIISLTIVALGTSLPELAVTISAAKKKKYAIVLGNVVGSNIFNSLCVIGIPTVVGYYSSHFYTTENALFTEFSIPLMLLATVLLILLSLLKNTPKWFGYLFVALYLFFIIGSFMKLKLF